MAKSKKGTLIAIGGHEEKKGDRVILQCVAELVGGGPLVVATLASEVADEMWDEYSKLFRDLGVRKVEHLNLDRRVDEADVPEVGLVKHARGVFFTGGDQLKITSKLGGSLLCEEIHRLYYERGGVIAGTSAGASVMSETMIVTGDERSHRIGDALLLAPGLGFVSGLVIDQHFGERGRVGRLLGIVSQNPRAVGIGIDENTAIVLDTPEHFEVIGDGAVYVLDGRPMTYTNAAEDNKDATLSAFNIRLHLLSAGDQFDVAAREPKSKGA